MNQKKNIKESSCRDRIDYTAIACLYCWYLWISRAGTATEKCIFQLIRWIVATFLPERCLNKLNQNIEYNRPARDIMYRDLENGQYIRIPKNMVYFTCAGYTLLPLTIVAAIIFSLFGWENVFRFNGGVIGVIFPIIFGVLIYICVDKLTKAIDVPHSYLSYFKEFERKDHAWVKKWEIYTILLFIGAIIAIVMGAICFIHVF